MVEVSAGMPSPLDSKACVLAVGTELTTGQITNRNSAWISEKLVNLGVEVVLHVTVADDRERIQDALDRCASQGRLIFVTGGLGPTSDDFTRDVIAAWAGQAMEFNESSWLHIQQRLGKLGVAVAESNRQQCYFPKGSRILENRAGTAHGFFISSERAHLWVLPGPPVEVASVWAQGEDGRGIDEMVLKRAPGVRRKELLTWQCLGKSEAALGELTENALHGSGLLIGYRAHRPFVEIKVWFEPETRARVMPWIEKLEAAIGPWVATRQGEDLAQRLLRELSAYDDISIVDAATGGILADRIGRALRSSEPGATRVASSITLATEWLAPTAPYEWVQGITAQADEESLTLAIAGFTSDGGWALGLRQGETVRHLQLQAPWSGPEGLERSRAYCVEIALKQWAQWLAQSMH